MVFMLFIAPIVFIQPAL